MVASGNCIICGRDCETGINILGKFICSGCEELIVNSDMDKVEYEKYKNSIKENIVKERVLKY